MEKKKKEKKKEKEKEKNRIKKKKVNAYSSIPVFPELVPRKTEPVPAAFGGHTLRHRCQMNPAHG